MNNPSLVKLCVQVCKDRCGDVITEEQAAKDLVKITRNAGGKEPSYEDIKEFYTA